MKDETLLQEARDAWADAIARDRENRQAAEDDIRFARLEEQWDAEDRRRRERQGRPCLTVNRLAPVIRQVVNDSRQNKPAIKVIPQDSGADPQTAEVMSGLIRNIEAASDADVAYDTAVEHAVTCGRGYFRINLAYACDDNWDQDIVFERVANPLSVVGDPDSTAADSSDWNLAFVSELMTKKAFRRQFPDAGEIDWDGLAEAGEHWCEGEHVRVAEYWTREKAARQIVLLSDGRVVPLEDFEANLEAFAAEGVTAEGMPRAVIGHKVRQHLITGVEVLRTTDWAGKWIPIVPVYGDEVNLNGRRHFRSLIRSAKDAQRMFNYENSVAVELGALAPKAPFIGPRGAFQTDAAKWEEIHTTNHPFVQYDGEIPPQRQAFSGPPLANLNGAEVAAGHIRAVTGIHEASLGQPSNEASGRAILARQREGDVSTFHFIDNLSRSIRHGGRILIDLIPKVYSPGRAIRVLGEEGQARSVTLGQPVSATGAGSEAVARVFDLWAGKYDLTVRAGPSFTTRREEAANQMIEFIRAFPPAAGAIGDILARNLDWPGAQEIEARLKAQIEGQGGDPEAAMRAEALAAQVAELTRILTAMSADRSVQNQKLLIDAFKAETDRLKAVREALPPAAVEAVVAKTVREVLASPDVAPHSPRPPSPFNQPK